MSKVEINTITQAKNHIRHCIQEEHKIQLSDKSVYDIAETIIAIVKHDLAPSIANTKSERSKRFAAEKRVRELEAQNSDLIEYIEKNSLHIVSQ
ncbi:hypothetical protein ABEY43_06290 [Priestia megaterium]